MAKAGRRRSRLAPCGSSVASASAVAAGTLVGAGEEERRADRLRHQRRGGDRSRPVVFGDQGDRRRSLRRGWSRGRPPAPPPAALGAGSEPPTRVVFLVAKAGIAELFGGLRRRRLGRRRPRCAGRRGAGAAPALGLCRRSRCRRAIAATMKTSATSDQRRQQSAPRGRAARPGGRARSPVADGLGRLRRSGAGRRPCVGCGLGASAPRRRRRSCSRQQATSALIGALRRPPAGDGTRRGRSPSWLVGQLTCGLVD